MGCSGTIRGTTKIRGVKAAGGVTEGIMQPDCMADEMTAPQAGSVLQLKAGLLGISPMIRRRILVPGTMSVEPTVNTVVEKRWSKSGARLMLQTRTRALDGTLKAKFRSWHPGLFNAANKDREIERAVACPHGFCCFRQGSPGVEIVDELEETVWMEEDGTFEIELRRRGDTA